MRYINRSLSIFGIAIGKNILREYVCANMYACTSMQLAYQAQLYAMQIANKSMAAGKIILNDGVHNIKLGDKIFFIMNATN